MSRHVSKRCKPQISPSANGRRSLSPSAADRLNERNAGLPVWVRAPVAGVEHFSALSRAKLYRVAGLVHKGEFVMPQEAVQRIGIPNLEAMMAGRASPNVNVEAPKFKIAVMQNDRQLAEFMKSHEGKAIILDTFDKNRSRFTSS